MIPLNMFPSTILPQIRAKVLVHQMPCGHLQPGNACVEQLSIQLVCEANQIRLHVFELQYERWIRHARSQCASGTCRHSKVMHACIHQMRRPLSGQTHARARARSRAVVERCGVQLVTVNPCLRVEDTGASHLLPKLEASALQS